jgi:diketogulonate reductase-like aldo/keto reductase
VISGTWWVSTSNVYDEKLTYPVHAGTVAIDTANTVHWDGSRMGEKDIADMRRAIPRKNLVEAWKDLEDNAKTLAKRLGGKEAATPSRTC